MVGLFHNITEIYITAGGGPGKWYQACHKMGGKQSPLGLPLNFGQDAPSCGSLLGAESTQIENQYVEDGWVLGDTVGACNTPGSCLPSPLLVKFKNKMPLFLQLL